MPSKLITIGTLIDESWELYRARFNELMSISGWLLLLAILYTISLALYPSASDLWLSNELSLSENVGVLLFAITNYLVAPLLGLWVVIALSRLIKMQISGRPVSSKLAITETKPRFIPTLIVSIMVALLLMAAILIGSGPSIVLVVLGTIFDSAILVGIGNFLLIIGVFAALILVFKWMVEYYLTPYMTILEGAQGKKAFTATRQLVRGRFCGVLMRLIVPKLVFILFGVFLMAIIVYVTEILLNVASGLNLDLRLRLFTLIEWTVPVVIGVLINPLIVLSDILLYRNLKGDYSHHIM
jgi:hypothetical protein